MRNNIKEVRCYCDYLKCLLSIRPLWCRFLSRTIEFGRFKIVSF